MSAPTSTRTVPPPLGQATFLFGSKYIFHRPEDLTQQFTSEEIECVYKDELFTLRCPTRIRESTSRAFGEAWQKYIQDSLESKSDALEGALISEKEPFVDGYDWDDLLDDLERSPGSQERLNKQNLEVELEEPPLLSLIEHERISKTFERRGISDTPLLELYNTRILRDVQIATDCIIDISPTGTISIKGDSEANINRAITKLANLEKMSADRNSRAWKSHFYLSNHGSRWRFGLLRDDLLIDRRLLRKTRPIYRIVKMPYLEIVNRYKVQTFARQAIVYDWETSRFWIDYEYPAFGKPENNPANWPSGSVASATDVSASDHPLLPFAKVQTVKAWLPGAAKAQEDPFKPKAEEEFDDHEKPPLDPKHYISTTRVIQGRKEERPAPVTRVLEQGSHDDSSSPFGDETAGEKGDSSSTETDVPKDQQLEAIAPFEDHLLEQRHGTAPNPISATAPPHDTAQPYVNEEWPSPETAMGIPDSPRPLHRSIRRNKGKGRASAPTPKSLAPTPPSLARMPVQTVSFTSADPPIGPAARFAAAYHAARGAPSSKVPPSISAPFMPATYSGSTEVPHSPSRRQSTPRARQQGSKTHRTSMKSSSKRSEAQQRLAQGQDGRFQEATGASATYLIAISKPKSRLNPLAPAWNPQTLSPIIEAKPLQAPLQPTALWNLEPLVKIDETKESLPVDDRVESSNVIRNGEESLIEFSDSEEPLVDLGGNNEPANQQHVRQASFTLLLPGITGRDLPTAVESADARLLSPSSAPPPFNATSNESGSANGYSSAQSSSQTPSSPQNAIPQGPTNTEDLLDLRSSDHTLVERREAISEIDSRLFLDGTSLLAPHVPDGTFKAFGPRIAHDKIMVAAVEALDMMRTVRGHVSLQLDIGHVVLLSDSSCKFPYEDGFDPIEWKAHMDPSRPWSMGKFTRFSPVLTAHWFDAEWMTDCPDANGARIFDESSRQERVFYEITCVNKTNETEFLITLEADGAYEILTAPKLEAEINVVFADHNWDAQLVAKSQTKPDYAEKQNLISIVDNVFVPGGTKLPEIYTHSTKRTIDITSILVKRRYSYQAASCRDFALQMTEVIDLPIEKSPHSQQYRAVAVEADLVRQHRRWYEASLISTAAQTILVENATLEVGEYASWTTDRVAQAGFLQDLMSLASGLIANSDAVGCPSAGFLPESDPERKAAAAEARAMRGFTGDLARSRWAPAPPRSLRRGVMGLPVSAIPPRIISPRPGVASEGRRATRGEGVDFLTPEASAGAKEEGREEEGGAPKPGGFW